MGLGCCCYASSSCEHATTALRPDSNMQTDDQKAVGVPAALGCRRRRLPSPLLLLPLLLPLLLVLVLRRLVGRPVQ